jgi:hypothetical protein
LGEEKWSFLTGGAVSSSPAVADVDGDHSLEVIFGSHDGRVYCLSSKGVKKWSYSLQSQTRSSPALGDLTGDGNPEIVVGADDNKVYFLAIDRDPDHDGLFDFEERKIGADPHNPDTDGDGILDGRDKYPFDYDNDGIPDSEDFAPSIKNSYIYIGVLVLVAFLLIGLLIFYKIFMVLKASEGVRRELALFKEDIQNLPEDIRNLARTLSRQPEKVKILLLSICVAASFVFMAISFQMYLFINYDARFCLIFCHAATETMQEPYYLWEESVHVQVTTCHDCHHATIQDNMQLVFKTFLFRPTEIEKHAHIHDDVCLTCHAEGAFREKIFNPLVSPSVVKLNSSVIPWRPNPSEMGHGVHVTREKIHCVECHKRAVHRFLPEEEICDKCHYDPKVGPPEKYMEEEHEGH